MAAAQPPNFAGVLGGARLEKRSVPIPYITRRVEGMTFDDAYSHFATAQIPAELSRVQQYSVLTYTESNKNEAFEIYFGSKRKEVGDHIIRSYCLNQQHDANGTTAILIDRVELDFHDWLHLTYEAYKRQDIEGDWLGYISSRLLPILTGVVAGLKQLFDVGLCHGNLLNGIALKREQGGQLVGYLFRMKNVIGKTVALQRRDVTHLLELFDQSVQLGYSTPTAAHEAKSDALKSTSPPPLFIYFQRFQRLEPVDASSRWIVDHPIFWTTTEKQIFMKRLFSCMYRMRLLHPSDIEFAFEKDSHFYNTAINPQTKDPRKDIRKLLAAVYIYGEKQEEGMYALRSSLVRFWRNAVEHFNQRLLELEPRTPTMTEEEVHQFLEEEIEFAAICHKCVEEYFFNSKKLQPSLHRPERALLFNDNLDRSKTRIKWF